MIVKVRLTQKKAIELDVNPASTILVASAVGVSFLGAGFLVPAIRIAMGTAGIATGLSALGIASSKPRIITDIKEGV
jgi:hypothetical protein